MSRLAETDRSQAAHSAPHDVLSSRHSRARTALATSTCPRQHHDHTLVNFSPERPLMVRPICRLVRDLCPLSKPYARQHRRGGVEPCRGVQPYAPTALRLYRPTPLHAIGCTVVVKIAETCRTRLAVHPLVCVCVCVCGFMHV